MSETGMIDARAEPGRPAMEDRAGRAREVKEGFAESAPADEISLASGQGNGAGAEQPQPSPCPT